MARQPNPNPVNPVQAPVPKEGPRGPRGPRPSPATAVADATSATLVKQFNALLNSLREAGILEKE